jgi:hypothetical protein
LKRFKFHFEFRKPCFSLFKSFDLKSWFKFIYLNQILKFQIWKVPKSLFELILFWIQFKFGLKIFKTPLVWIQNSETKFKIKLHILILSFWPETYFLGPVLRRSFSSSFPHQPSRLASPLVLSDPPNLHLLRPEGSATTGFGRVVDLPLAPPPILQNATTARPLPSSSALNQRHPISTPLKLSNEVNTAPAADHLLSAPLPPPRPIKRRQYVPHALPQLSPPPHSMRRAIGAHRPPSLFSVAGLSLPLRCPKPPLVSTVWPPPLFLCSRS